MSSPDISDEDKCVCAWCDNWFWKDSDDTIWGHYFESGEYCCPDCIEKIFDYWWENKLRYKSSVDQSQS